MNSAPITGAIDAPDVPQHRQGDEPDGRLHPDRDEGAAGPRRISSAGAAADDLFRRFFGGPNAARPGAPADGRAGTGRGRNRRRPQIARASGTGFIISKDGFILTNSHVVEGATKIQVSLYGDDDRFYAAKLIGRDQLTDSALIQLDRKADHADA